MKKPLLKNTKDDEDVGYILIDPPVTAYSSEEDILVWINELKTDPHRNRQEVREALKDAQEMLKRRKEQ